MHEVSYIWINYFWSSLKGNGPEAIVQTVVYALAAVLFIPPVRHFFKRHFESVHEKLEAHHLQLLAQAEQHHKEHLEALRALAPKTVAKKPAKKVVKKVVKKVPTKRARR